MKSCGSAKGTSGGPEPHAAAAGMRAAAIREDEGIGGDVVQLGEVRRREAVGPPEAVDLKPAPHGLAFHVSEKRFQGLVVAYLAAAAALGEHAEAHAELLGEGRSEEHTSELQS